MRKATQSGVGGLYCVAAAASAESSAVDRRGALLSNNTTSTVGDRRVGHYLVTQL